MLIRICFSRKGKVITKIKKIKARKERAVSFAWVFVQCWHSAKVYRPTEYFINASGHWANLV
jgi:hypothetical protein